MAVVPEAHWDVELQASCPGCATLETLWFHGGVLRPTSRFVQTDGRIYHDCGTPKPCLVFPRFKERVSSSVRV